MRHRWYEPRTGRFLSPDPLGFAGGPNLYAFAGGDPVNKADPSGLKSCIQDPSGCFTDLRGADDKGNGGDSPPCRQKSAVRSLLGKVWALPNTGLGLLAAGAAYGAGIVTNSDPQFQFGNGALQLLNSPVNYDDRALTLGHVQVYGTGRGPDTMVRSYSGRIVNLGLHEQGHTEQAEILGIHFLLFWAVGGGVSPSNPLELGADKFAAGESCNGL